MASYDVALTSSAERELKKLPGPLVATAPALAKIGLERGTPGLLGNPRAAHAASYGWSTVPLTA